MARPQKEGMDYFPHDTDAVNDKKLEALRALYGNDGYAFYFIMLEQIYQEKDFQIDVSDAETREEIFQILAKKVSVSIDVFKQILSTALKWGCFDKELYEQKGILTSAGIKKRASVVIEKRKKMRENYRLQKEGVSDAETREETEEETPQRKEKKSKEKNSTSFSNEKEERIADDAPNNKQIIAELVDFYREIEGIAPEQSDYSFVGRLYNEHGYDAVLEKLNDLGKRIEAGFKPDRPKIYLMSMFKDRPTREPPPAPSYPYKAFFKYKVGEA